ncbi:MAG: hypothetical protein Q4G26_07600 [Paracoccus sp. (in: a-proteobacteria)]|nr:hypothetical protein [Paracoccus sp. (in: a-proteobacteria)]
MRQSFLLAASGAIAALTLAACGPETETEISRAEADLRVGEVIAPAPPTVATGVIQPANTLNGTYNLRSSECGQAGSEGALAIEGSRFRFSQAQCTAIASSVKGNATETQLNCSHDAQSFERLVNLRLSPGILQMEEKGVGLRYYRCPAA